MTIHLVRLIVRARKSEETITFAQTVTFVYGPVGTGKSTVARLVDFCLGGSIDPTPAMQKEFVAAELVAKMGVYVVTFERGADDSKSVQVTWTNGIDEEESINAPIDAGPTPVHGDDVFNLSDLIFKLSGVTPIKVRKNRQDINSPLVRLSFRDVMWYCYLKQERLDSSFFRMEEPFKMWKSRDVMRFITGMYSDRLNQLQGELEELTDAQRGKRDAVIQIRQFMKQFDMGDEGGLARQLEASQKELDEVLARRGEIERRRSSETHAAEPLRSQLRTVSEEIEALKQSFLDLDLQASQKERLRAELINSKTKANRADTASRLLEGATFETCPQCGTALESHAPNDGNCPLCRRVPQRSVPSAEDMEVLRRDVNERIDELADALSRHRQERARLENVISRRREELRRLDAELTAELAQYDTAYVSTVRAADREVARLQERLAQLAKLRAMPNAIAALVREAEALQGPIENLRAEIAGERERMTLADSRIAKIEDRFKEIMRAVQFPDVSADDVVAIDSKTWKPSVRHEDISWGFWEAGSGGKKTLFNVCYALAIHSVAAEEGMPLPGFLIIDSPTKNISKAENLEVVKALYQEIYRRSVMPGNEIQFLLIDSELVRPTIEVPGFVERRMAGQPGAPRLISYYEGP